MKKALQIERLNSLRNEMTHLWGAVFIIGGGSLALFFNEPNLIKSIFAFLGLIISIMAFNAYFIRRNEMFKMLKELEDKE